MDNARQVRVQHPLTWRFALCQYHFDANFGLFYLDSNLGFSLWPLFILLFVFHFFCIVLILTQLPVSWSVPIQMRLRAAVQHLSHTICRFSSRSTAVTASETLALGRPDGQSLYFGLCFTMCTTQPPFCDRLAKTLHCKARRKKHLVLRQLKNTKTLRS